MNVTEIVVGSSGQCLLILKNKNHSNAYYRTKYRRLYGINRIYVVIQKKQTLKKYFKTIFYNDLQIMKEKYFPTVNIDFEMM